jgi:hypothetical protein
MNSDQFIAGQQKYFVGSYGQFLAFGGPSVHFHNECLRAGQEDFLSNRHVEMLYATLTAWGMHRMGDSAKTKTKLRGWECFNRSLTGLRMALKKFRGHRMLEMSEAEYSAAILQLRPDYFALDLSVSDATIVVNSKALHHLLPEFIPPVDRQYTVRFFRYAPERWLDANGKFRLVQLPSQRDAQFELFHETCVAVKRLMARVEPWLLEEQLCQHGVSAPKAMDNAIVNYVRIASGQQ